MARQSAGGGHDMRCSGPTVGNGEAIGLEHCKGVGLVVPVAGGPDRAEVLVEGLVELCGGGSRLRSRRRRAACGCARMAGRGRASR